MPFRLYNPDDRPQGAHSMAPPHSSISETLEKGLRILDLFGSEGTGLTLGAISKRIGVNKTSVHRYVSTYCALGYLQRDEQSRLYKLGARTIALAHSFLQKGEMVQQVKPLVDEVHAKYDLHVDVGMVQNDAIYLIYRRESKDTLAFRHFTTGFGLYYLATGKAAMAFMEEKELHRLLGRLMLEPKTERTICDKARLIAELREIQARGYSLNREEYMPGLIAIGAPLMNLRSQRVVGGVSFDSSTAQYSIEEFEKRYASLLVELAKKLSAAVST